MLFLHIVRNGALKANVAKCAVVVFRNEKKLDGAWTWGGLFFATP